MVTLIEIIGIERKKDKDGNAYFKTHAIAEDGDELIGWSTEWDAFDVGHKVERFFHKGQAKMRHKKPDNG